MIVASGATFQDAKHEAANTGAQPAIAGRVLNVSSADTVREALETAACLPEAISRFLNRQQERLEETGIRMPDDTLASGTKLFVEPHLVDRRQASRSGRKNQKEMTGDTPVEPGSDTWDEAILKTMSHHRTLAIVGPPGMGKSFVTRQLILAETARVASRVRRGGSISLPIWITAAELAEAAPGTEQIGNVLVAALRARYPGGEFPEHPLALWLEAHLDAPGNVLVVDALEEVGSDHLRRLRKRLSALGQLEHVRLIVTCRLYPWEVTWRERLSWSELSSFQLGDFEEQQVAGFVERFSVAADRDGLANEITQRLHGNTRLAELCGNPLVLSYVCRLLMRDDLPAESRLVTVLERIIRRLLRNDDDGGELPWEPGDALWAIGRAAWHLFRGDPSVTRFSRRSFLEALGQDTDRIRDLCDKSVPAFWQEMERLGVVVPVAAASGGEMLY
ncbi:MAG: hypothetical protein KAI66_02565, partial [Lentisphaeria bacterium]|nr:hypothetical protein [Lentisphaeria bacterium]